MSTTVKKLAGAAGLLALAVAGWALTRPRPAPPAPPAVTAPAADGSTLTTVADPAQVFQKAFWRRPEAADTILHAERREWSTPADGVKRWQWFLSVEPGPGLKEYLAANPFALAPVPPAEEPAAFAAALGASPPEWFPKNGKGYQIQKHLSGSFLLLTSEDGKTLHATDTGTGFAPPERAP